MASHGGAQKQPDTPGQIWRVLGCFQTCGGHPRKASSSSRPDQRSFVPLAKRCIRNITSREMYSGVPLEKRRYRRRLDLARQPCSSQTSARGLPIHLRIWSFFCRNSGRPLMLPIPLHSEGTGTVAAKICLCGSNGSHPWPIQNGPKRNPLDPLHRDMARTSEGRATCAHQETCQAHP